MKVPDHYPGGRFGLVAAAIVVCLVAGDVASAATVTYSTTGTFSGAGASGNTLRSDFGKGKSVLSFTGSNETVQVNPPPVAQIFLGTFTLTAGDWLDTYIGIGKLGGSFRLTLKQTAPTDGIGEASTSLLLGLVSRKNGGAVLYFDDPTFTIGSVSYRVNPIVLVPVGSAQFTGTLTAAQAAAEVVVVPLPAAAWGGLALMGFVGVNKLRRRASSLAA
jgi:hypothetical protein